MVEGKDWAKVQEARNSTKETISQTPSQNGRKKRRTDLTKKLLDEKRVQNEVRDLPGEFSLLCPEWPDER